MTICQQIQNHSAVSLLAIKAPAAPTKRERVHIPRLDQLEEEKRLLKALAMRDKQWLEAIHLAGGSVQP